MTQKKDNEVELFMEKELLVPYNHIVSQINGKQFHIRILMSFNHWLQLPKENARFIVENMYMLHTGSLLILDVQNNILHRRNDPTAHMVYGIPTALNTGLHTIILSIKKLLTLGHAKIGQLYCKHFLEIIRGNGKEIYWRDNLQCPTEEQYNHMLLQKTGYLINFCIQVMQLYSTNKEDYSNIALTMGIYFQLRNEYWSIANTEEVKSQYYCEYLTEGNFSLPIIHAAKQKGGEAVLNIFRQRTRDASLKNYCVELLEELGSMQYTRNRLFQLERRIRDEIDKLGGNPELVSILNEMTNAN